MAENEAKEEKKDEKISDEIENLFTKFEDIVQTQKSTVPKNPIEAEKQKLIDFGMNPEEMNSPAAENIEELLKRDTGMVIAEATKPFRLANRDKNIPPLQANSKGDAFVMTMGDYNNLHKINNDILFKPSKMKFKDYFRRYQGQDLNGKKLLCWRYGGLGDLVCVTNILNYLKTTYPDAEINMATGPQNVLFLHSWKKGIIEKAMTMPFQKEALDYHDYHLTFINSIENCNEKRTSDYYKIMQKMAGVDYDPNEYMVELIPIQQILDNVKTHIAPNTIFCHMRSTSPVRTMRNSTWKNIILNLLDSGFRVGLLDSVDQMENLNRCIETWGFNKNFVQNLSVYNLDPNFMVALMSLAKGLICIDSGPMHVAHALKKPILSFVGSFPWKTIGGEYYKTAIGVDPEDFNVCNMYPCYLNNHVDACPYVSYGQAPGCLEIIDHEKYVKQFIEKIKENEKK